MKKGALVPDNVMQKMIIDEMKHLKVQAWLLDGESASRCDCKEMAVNVAWLV